ncbi:MAG: YebC/PmpR family DNA-binding transcriptional regulator [Gammaproteobacteria bacterium]|nr:YebC/PmpR family DNA-binding transcriptional regulator [Gammaproteobacteria bacterium]
MAGHSKWANIKHRKARQDAKRAKVWTKLIRELTVAARLGGASVDDNPRLRAAVDNALSGNMPRDTIDRAIARGAGDGEEGHLDEVTYEGYGPGGVAILVEVMTDNRNRTVAEVRHAFSKFNGNLGTDGSVAYMFERRGELHFEAGVDEEAVMEVALEAGANDVESDDEGNVTVITTFQAFGGVLDAFRSSEMEPAHWEVGMIPSNSVDCDTELTEKVSVLVEALDDLDDVQNVFTNASFNLTKD